MHVHFIVHEAFEAPGAYEDWARVRGHGITFSRLYDGDSLPKTSGDIDLLVVMGGPQDPTVTTAECQYFDVQAECDLIGQCVDQGKAVVGICLGSQLLGMAMGGPYEKSPETEIGNFPICLTSHGKTDGKFSHFPCEAVVGHWHNDMPGLTPDAQIIASSRGCPRQIVRYGPLLYGFQCHLEFKTEVIELLIEASEDELGKLRDRKYVQKALELQAFDYAEMNEMLYKFLDKLEMEYERGAGKRWKPS